ncbi:MAG: four-helix bundle copper-binding protein [Nitrospira sp.]
MQNQPVSDQQDCINACFSCAQMCERCADDMIGMTHQSHDDLMTRCIRLCRDCASICILSAQWMSRSSLQTQSLCRLCAEICDQCAEVCERHAPDHPLCGPCAEACRRCAESCREIVGSGAHTT